MSRQIVLDTETTGLETSKGHRIIEIGCVEMINRKLTKNNFHIYINPDRLIDAEAEAVHGISNNFLADKPRFSEIINEFIDYIRGAELVIHNAPFDVGFLDYEFALQGRQERIGDLCTVFDSLVYARKKHPGQKNNLDVLCSRYFINNEERVFHGALLDAEILANVYLAMTGGQLDMTLAADENDAGNHQNMAAGQRQANWNVPVISATPEELEAHQTYLELLERKSEGNCLWFPRMPEPDELN